MSCALAVLYSDLLLSDHLINSNERKVDEITLFYFSEQKKRTKLPIILSSVLSVDSVACSCGEHCREKNGGCLLALDVLDR